MTGDLDAGARRALMEVNKQVADQGQREDAAGKASAWYHPFDWRDLLLFMMPVTAIVIAMFWGAE
jgi:hypothetical protein